MLPSAGPPPARHPFGGLGALLNAQERIAQAKFLGKLMVRYGYKLEPRQLGASEQNKIGRTILLLLEEHDPCDIEDAIRHGMSNLWPWSADSRPWTVAEFNKNYFAALGAAGRHANLVPHRLQEIPSAAPTDD